LIASKQSGWVFQNTRDFPSEEIPLGYRLRSPLPIGEIAKPVPSKAKESSSLLAMPAQPSSQFSPTPSLVSISGSRSISISRKKDAYCSFDNRALWE